MTRVRIVMAVASLGALAAGYLMFGGDNPRMIEQPHLRGYDMRLATLPAGTVTLERPAKVAFVPSTPQTLARGKVYYGYYCLACHGHRGDGNGPVGESYLPKPADLRRPQVGSYSDQQLLDAMIDGTGHEPAMAYTVRPEHRGYLVAYVRSLRSAK